MSDGELYKNIIKKRAVNYLANKSVKAVIDDAKKDFPTQKHYYSVAKTKEELKKVHEWFKKWFGDYP